MINKLLKISENKGTDAQAFDKCYEFLSHSPCNSFNPKSIVYAHVHAQFLDINKMLIKARKEYCAMDKNKTWTKTYAKQYRDEIPCKQQTHRLSDITALVASSTLVDKHIIKFKSKLKQLNRENILIWKKWQTAN